MATSERADPTTDLILDMSDSLRWTSIQSKARTFTSNDQGLYYLTFQRCEVRTSSDGQR